MIITNSNNYPITIEYRIEYIDSPTEFETSSCGLYHHTKISVPNSYTVSITPEISIDIPCDDIEMNQVLMTFVEKTTNDIVPTFSKKEIVFDLIDNEDKYINCFITRCSPHENHITYKFICDHFDVTHRRIYSGTYQIPNAYHGSIMEYIIEHSDTHFKTHQQ